MTRAGLARFADRLGLALLGALLVGAYAMAPRIAIIPYFSLVPWAVLYSDPSRKKVSIGYFALAVWLTWVLSHQAAFRFGWWAPFLMGVYLVPLWLVFPPLFRALQPLGLPRTLTLPLAWVTVEWLRATFVLGHFDVFLLGYSQARFVRLAQIVDVTGVYGLSLLLAAVNGLIADAFFAWRDGGRRLAALREDRRLVQCSRVVLACFVLAVVYGAVRLASTKLDDDGPRLAVIQPNVRHTPRNYFGVSLLQLFQTDRDVPQGAADLIVWPENAILDDLTRRGDYLDDLAWIGTRKQAAVLLGAQAHPDGKPDRTTNSAFLVDDTGRLRERYDKQILYPWTEAVPLDDLLGRIVPPAQRFQRTLIRKAWGFVSPGVPGTRTVVFRLPWRGGTIPFAVLICVENTYPPLVAEAARSGARFLVNITSEGEVSGVIQEQLLRVCVLRAIENRIAYVRAGNTGISAFIDPLGRVRSVLRGKGGGTVSVAGTLIDRVSLASGRPTLYARSHDAFALLCVALTGILAGRAFLRRRRAGPPPAVSVATALLASLVTLGCGGGFSKACPDEAACRDSLAREADAFRASSAAESAVIFFDGVATHYPALGPEARVYQAYFLDQAGETENAARLYETVLRQSPAANTWALLGSARMRLNDFPGAAQAFRRALATGPPSAHVLGLLARSLWESGDLEGARAATGALLAIQADDPAGLTVLGKLEYEAGRLDAADAAFRRAAAADPKHVESRYWLARLAWREGRTSEAEAHLAALRAVEESLGRGARLE